VVIVLPPSAPVIDAIWSYPVMAAASQSGQSRPFCVFQA
jgi:hypothetical protein